MHGYNIYSYLSRTNLTTDTVAIAILGAGGYNVINCMWCSHVHNYII